MNKIKHISVWNLERGQKREQTYAGTNPKWAGSPTLQIQQALEGVGSQTEEKVFFKSKRKEKPYKNIVRVC